MLPRIKLLFVFIVLLLSTNHIVASISLGELRCELLENPVGIDTKSPRFSWKIFATTERNVVQTSYRILVASSIEKLSQNIGDLWDSGIVYSDQSQWINYSGEKLKSNHIYYWKVNVQTNKGNATWSDYAFWSMGLLNENDWKSRWIGIDKAMPWDSETQFSRLSARYLRTEFNIQKSIKRATVHIAGLGLYEMYLNGERVGNQVLAPAPADYNKTILYNSFDVTSMLNDDINAIGVTLGNGRYYTMRKNFKPYKIADYGYPKMRLTMIVEYDDGTKDTIVSDEKWKLMADGPILANNEYDGEEYDARKELKGWSVAGYDDSAWEQAKRVSIPNGTLRAQMMEGMKVVDTLKPTSITRLADNKYILDMGQNMVGWIKFNLSANRGDSIKLRFAETLQEDGNIYVRNLRDAKVTDIYWFKGEGVEEWAPRFVYHGFRYVEVTGFAGKLSKDNFVGEVVNDKMNILGSFKSSSAVINQVLKNAYWGIQGNYKGMPVDCPQRNERQPWLGDRTMGTWGESFIFENAQLYSKWVDDIREAQKKDGRIPDVAPAYWNYYSDNVTWPAALAFTCDMLYTQFGELRPTEKNYHAIRKWMNYMKEQYMTDDYIVTRDKYGDWCVPPESLELIHSKDPRRQTDGSLISTAYYYKLLQIMGKFATLQGLQDDFNEYSSLSKSIKQSFNKKFFDNDSLFYGNNTATSNLLPLAFDMIPDEYLPDVEKHIVDEILVRNKGHISTGVIGSQWILRELSKMGRADLSYLLSSNDTYPSWGYMAKRGATTIWELWNGDTANPEMNSGNHVMLLGDFIPYCYQNLAGIKSDESQVAFKKIIMKPDFDIQELGYVDASYTTPYGEVVSNWKKTFEQLQWQITVPPNSSAIVYFPPNSYDITESGKKIPANSEIIKVDNPRSSSIAFEIGSGSYSFNMKLDVGVGKWRKGIVEEKFLYESAPFPECHAATIAETPDGLIAAFFGGTKERNPDVEIWISKKNGNEWTPPVSVANGVINDTLRKACWNPVLYQVPKGELMLFYKIGNSVGDWTGHLIRSFDNGNTWTEPEDLPDGFIGPVKNKPEMIDDKIVCPSSMEGSPGWRLHFEITEDKGKTWRKVGPINDGLTVNAIQPSILFHKDGKMQVLARSREGAIAEAWSSDKGETWTDVTLSNLPNNNSGTDAVSLKDGRQLVVYNHVKTPEGAKKGSRTPLNVSLSSDGINWDASLILDDSPISQYSYPSVIQGEDGYIHIVYTWRRQRVKYVKIDPKKIEAIPFAGEAWPE